MTPPDQSEYTELRATIRERGTTRVWIFVVTTIAWAALALADATLAAAPLVTLVALLVLVGGFEAVFALHVGAERIGRYVQLVYESDGRGWEHAAMGFGRPAGAARADALFAAPFAIAALLNLVPALLVGPTREELVFTAGAHALFLVRIAYGRAVARRQRAIDLERFRQLTAESR